MQKLLIGAATAVLVLAAGSASAKQFQINLSPYCDLFTVSSEDGGKTTYAFVSMNTNCDDGYGYGGVAKIASLGGLKYAAMGGVLFADGTGELWNLQLQTPFATGGAWRLSESTDGVNFTLINSGTYTVEGAGVVHINGKPASLGR